jgi:hypothetical protein
MSEDSWLDVVVFRRKVDFHVAWALPHLVGAPGARFQDDVDGALD